MGKRLTTLVLVSRWFQVICGLSALIADAIGSSNSIGVYYDTSVIALFSGSASCISYAVFFGLVGFWRFYRPADLYWRLSLIFDWLALILAFGSLIISTLCPLFGGGNSAYASISLALLTSLASIPPLVETHTLKRKGRLGDRRGRGEIEDGKHDWFHMETSPAQSQTGAAAGMRSSSTKPQSHLHEPIMTADAEDGDAVVVAPAVLPDEEAGLR